MMALIGSGGDAYYSDWNAALKSNVGLWGLSKTRLGSYMLVGDYMAYSKDRAVQNEEFKNVQGVTKTVNYGSAVSKADTSGESENRVRAALLEEEERLKHMNDTGSAKLMGGM